MVFALSVILLLFRIVCPAYIAALAENAATLVFGELAATIADEAQKGSFPHDIFPNDAVRGIFTLILYPFFPILRYNSTDGIIDTGGDAVCHDC